MRSAPSVSYPVGRSVSSGLLRLVLWLAGAGVAVLWLATGQADAARAAAAAMALAASGAWAAWSWRSERAGLLAWDGARWVFQADGQEEPGALHAALDVQSVLLVRWSARREGWFWLERSRDPARWDALRRAVHSPAFADPQRGAEAAGEP